jgi:hypothetical protein
MKISRKEKRVVSILIIVVEVVAVAEVEAGPPLCSNLLQLMI